MADHPFEPNAADSVEPRDQAWRLRALHAPAGAFPVPITTVGLTIGRAESNDIVLPSDEFPGVSGTHARVVLRDGAVYVEDLGSKNGTRVAGEPIKRVAVEHGDVFELGAGGPRFVVLSPGVSDQTVIVSERALPKKSMGADTVEMVRERLGIPAHTKVTDVVTKHNRRNTYLLVFVMVLLVAGGIYGIRVLQRTEEDVHKLQQRIDEQVAASQGQIDEHRSEWRKRVDKMELSYATARTEQKRALEQERDRLRTEMKSRVSATELEKLRTQLAATDKRLATYDPVKVAQARLATVSQVGRAVVLVEVTQTFVEPKTKRKLYIESVSGGGLVPNLKRAGRLYQQDSTGSGFCFNSEGWILTNAHVALKKDSETELRLGPNVVLDPVVDLKVVFSNTDRRLQAEIRGWVSDGNQDLAVLKIEPFPGMPHTADLDPTLPEPPPGTTVYLLGFPLGKRALQQGETVIASAFRGIVSRSVDNFIQVDAAVHPGNSGGPVIDEDGHIIGVVVGMQRVNADVASSDMGYIIPIARAKAVWPLKAKTKPKGN